MKKALIIGACGFVGGYLAEQLQSRFKVCATKLKEEVWTLPAIPSYDLDILDKEAVEALLKEIRPDYIVHLAAQSSVSLSWRNPGLTIDVNVKGSVNLLEAVRTLDAPPRILMIGSGEEYGYVREEELPIREEIARMRYIDEKELAQLDGLEDTIKTVLGNLATTGGDEDAA